MVKQKLEIQVDCIYHMTQEITINLKWKITNKKYSEELRIQTKSYTKT
jgi:hypothetical protein